MPSAPLLRDEIQMERQHWSLPKGAIFPDGSRASPGMEQHYTLDFAFTSLDYEGGHADLSQRENNVEVRELGEDPAIPES